MTVNPETVFTGDFSMGTDSWTVFGSRDSDLPTPILGTVGGDGMSSLWYMVGNASIPSASLNQPPYVAGIQRVIKGLTVGALYTVNAYVKRGTCYVTTYAIGCAGIGRGTAVTLVQDADPVLITYTFKATATKHTIQIFQTQTITVTASAIVGDFERLEVASVSIDFIPSVYALEALVGDPATATSRVGYAIVGTSAVVGSTPNGLIVGSSFVGPDAFVGSDYGMVWTDFTGKCTGIHTNRGAEQTGVAIRLKVGTLTATFKNAGDIDLSLGFGIGSPVRLRDTTSNTVVWTGVLLDYNYELRKGTSDYRVAWSCVDVMASLSKVVASQSAQTFTNRMTTLASLAGLVSPMPEASPFITGYSSTPADVGNGSFTVSSETLGALATPMSIGQAIDLACSSGQAMVYVAGTGNLHQGPNAGRSSFYINGGIPDGYADVPLGPYTRTYTGIASGMDSKSVCNVLNVTNKTTGTSFTVSSSSSVGLYGRREQSLEMAWSTDAMAQLVASDYIAKNSESVFSVTSLTTKARFSVTEPLGSPIAVVQNSRIAYAWLISEQIVIKPSTSISTGQSVTYTYGLAPRQRNYDDQMILQN